MATSSDRAQPSDPASRLVAWREPVTRARFVDARRARQLAKLDITTIGQLLHHAPARYLDLTHTSPLGAVGPGDATVTGRVHEIVVRRPRKRLMVTEVTLVDGTGTLIGIWFNQPWVERQFKVGQQLAFAGPVKLDYGLKKITQPFVEQLEEGGEYVHSGHILPVHPTTEGLSVGWLRRLIAAALDDFADVSEYLPRDLRARQSLAPYAWALRSLHFPESLDAAALARNRLSFSELFDLQLLIARRRHVRTVETVGTRHVTGGPTRTALQSTIPFTLTADQQTAVTEILADMAGDHPMQRLLLGDVGTGKTLVAAFALAAVADTGTQAAMMAPTEVL
ncbi:MAG: ATP-dependent DNA helicase RecG, partial [Actinomycetes bacterium]|nr:ATP-dependent DNA helicase RecG [Actinomycetes bacterium]